MLAVGWLVRAAFIAFVPARIHSADVDSWIAVARELRRGADPYVTTTFLGWPPLWLVVIWIIDHVSRAVDISFFLALRLFLILVESVVVWLLHRFLTRVAPAEARRIVLAAISLDPIAILLVCQHGNFDVLVALTCLAGALALAVYPRTHDVALWLAGALAFGIGALAKTIPLALAPLLARGWKLSSAPARAVAAAVFVGPALLGVAVIYVLAPVAVRQHVLLYRSSAGGYGLTGIADAAGLSSVADAYARIVFPLVLLAVGAFAFARLAHRDLDARRVLLATALILLGLPALGSGYAPQYAYWWLPVLAATYPLFDRGWRRLLLVFYAVAAADYIWEYAVLVDHGAWLLSLFPGAGSLQDLHRFETPAWETVFRLPLFAASLAVVVGGMLRLTDWRPLVWPLRLSPGANRT